MRNLINCSIICLMIVLSSPTFGQIQIQSEGKAKSNSELKKEVSYIQWFDDGYYFKMADYKCSKFHLYGDNFIIKIYLGKNASEVKQSGAVLQQWFDGAKNDAFIITTNPNGQNVCLYKFNANIYASYGTETHCKATRLQFGADMTAAIAGSSYATPRERDELMANIEFGDYVLTGLCSFKKDFLKSIENFREPGQVTQNYRQEVSVKIGALKKKAKEKGISEGISVQEYNTIIRELTKSDKEIDWVTIDHMNTVITELMKNNSKINTQDFESQLSQQGDINGKIEIFESYYSQL